MENFNELFDVNALKQSLNDAKQNTTEFKDVVPGTYEVKLEKCDLVKSSTNKPMCKMQFRIVDGDYENQCIFYNKVLIGVNKDTGELSALPLHFNNEFLKSMRVFDDDDITFEDFNDYKNLLLDIAEEANRRKLTFKLQYSVKNDFANYKILEVYNN